MMKRKDNAFKKIFVLAGIFSLLILSGCAEEILYNNLTQEDANKVMVLLEQNGISATLASEQKQNQLFWQIKVEKSVLPRARELIVGSNIIAPRSPGLQEVYQAGGKSGGWIKTPGEERARYILALKGEVINALKRLPEVVDADVVLNIPEKAKLDIEKKRPTASVVVKAQKPAAGETALSEIVIQQWVANTVEDLAARDVSVLINYVAPIGTALRPGETITLPKQGEKFDEIKSGDYKPVRLMGLNLSRESRQRLKIYLLVFFAILLLLSIALIITVIQASRQRQELKAIKSGQEPHAIEGEVMEGGSRRLEGPRLEAEDREKQL